MDFEEWWHAGGFQQWADTVDTDIRGAIKMVFNAGREQGRKEGLERAAEIVEAFHAGKQTWQQFWGSEAELLEQVRELIERGEVG